LHNIGLVQFESDSAPDEAHDDAVLPREMVLKTRCLCVLGTMERPPSRMIDGLFT